MIAGGYNWEIIAVLKTNIPLQDKRGEDLYRPLAQFQ